MLSEQTLLNQFQHENDTWKRDLAFIREESILIKNRLSDIVKSMDNDRARMLEQIEYFQNCFLAQDDKIRTLVKEVQNHGNLLVRDVYEDGHLIRSVKSLQARLRKEMVKTEREFNKLKFEFNNYLSEALQT